MRAVAIVAALAAAMIGPAAAHATFPGATGAIAFISDRGGNNEIYTTHPYGSPVHTLLTDNGANDRSPAWSASGTELAFASNRDGDFEIYRMPAAGSPTPTRLTNNSIADGSPAWAPNDAVLVIVREAASGDTDLVILAADGSGVTAPLTASAAVSGEVEPTWAPNGTRIGFSAFPPGGTQRDIFSINPDGTGLVNLTNSATRDDREPNWSPGNARITYSSFHDSNYEIHVMNADGTGDSNISNYPSADDRDPAWSPDATRIAFTGRRAAADRIMNIASNGVNPALEVASGSEPDWRSVQTDCVDEIDNDGDGKIDYPNDPGCGSAYGSEDPACNDNQDNDGDALVDFADDRGCHSWSDDDEAGPYQCSDGIDNDADGKIDNPVDGGCDADWDDDETGPVCLDLIDNDGDGLTDYPDDPGCQVTADNDETDPACVDGIDNDGDGKIDYPDDAGCIGTWDEDETNPACVDGFDNDGDGKIDSSDAGCVGTWDDDETNPACDDGNDNDADGKIDYPNDPGCSSASDNNESNGPPYIRPKSAPSFEVPLVPAFQACALPGNRQHGPPLDAPSCSPPVATSTTVTVGTPDANGGPVKAAGTFKLTVKLGAPGWPADSDVMMVTSITDVRCRAASTSCGNRNALAGWDYTGELQATATMRITDRRNGTSELGGAESATVADLPFSFRFVCGNSADTTIGGTCSTNTSFRSIVGGSIGEGDRMVMELGQLVVNDGGPDGWISTTPNTQFMKQGVFVP